tara:strand:+ start:3682 stop:4965 length:1284 start_codon:yes stop_codon:yes gene_type:complete
MPNSIDNNVGSKLWSEQDVALYNKLDFYLAKQQVDFFPQWETYGKLLSTQRWTPNMGSVMKGVHKEPAPVLRNMFFPNTLDSEPKKDIIEVRENAQSARLHWHRFESQLLYVTPSFQDFLTDSVTAANEDIARKVKVAEDMFYRTYLFHASPYVWVCGKNNNTAELTPATYIAGSVAAAGISQAKTTAEIQTLVSTVGDALTLKGLAKLGTVMTTDLEANYYEGSAGNEVDEGLKGKYCLVTSGEVWDNFQFDPFLLANRQINLDVVTGKFRGSFFGRWTSMLERFPIRIKADGTIPAPQTLELNSAAQDYGETKPNPEYTAAPYEVSFAFGADGYKKLEVGPPPAAFAKGEMSMKDFRGLQWNGMTRITKDILVNVLNEAGTMVQDTNKYGHYLQLISELTMGICPTRRRNVIPILYRRQRVGANA